jgi:hypothetical protein
MMVAMKSSIVLLSVAVAVCLFTTRATSQTNETQGIPFKDGVEVRINGQGPFHFGLDTGASQAFWINPQFASQLNLPVTSHTHIHVPNDPNAPLADVLRIDDLEVAGYSFHHVIGVGFSKGQGVLGIELFKDVVVTLDYPGDRLSVSDKSLPEADERHIFNYTEDKTIPVLRVMLGGVPVEGYLDSGGARNSGAVMVPLEVASQLRLVAPMQPKGSVSNALGNSSNYYTATLDGDLMIGDLTIHRPALLINDLFPFVDLGGICNQLVITLDHRNHRLRLELASAR